ncbi:uncharacterized protein LAJ45_07441 [Morchella importuna]|nr:uncharacterized protein LAJ45_07441 [Morchella importuna]KAH8148340.1 hypothetical protein LAJ45_07441 [Morchella importuna]
MSRNRRIVAWRTPADLLEVKAAFYPVSNGEDLRPMALAKVRAWISRTRIPHAIEATALLTEATLHDTSSHSALNSRLAYSTAICRFVNGLIDPAQQAQFALPMHILARNLNLPASFVEIRHAATHDMLPGLPVLRAVAARALAWLWDNYWVSVGVKWTSEVTGSGEEAVLQSKARMALKRWRQLRRDDPRKPLKRFDKTPEGRETYKIIKECAAICRGEEGKEALIEAFLEEKGLIPAGKKKAPLMNGAFHLWLPLLDSLDASVSGFSNMLLSAMLDIFNTNRPLFTLLDGTNPDDTHPPEFMEAVLAWLKHLTSTNPEPKTNFGHRAISPIDYDELIKQCVVRPTERGLKFLRHLLNEYPAMNEKYARVVEIAATQVVLPPARKAENCTDTRKRKLEEVEAEVKEFEARFEAMKRQKAEQEARLRDGDAMQVEAVVETVKAGRWKKWSGEWTQRPIGVL